MKLLFNKEYTGFCVIASGILSLGGYWRASLYIAHYFHGYEYYMARLDPLTPLAFIILVYYFAYYFKHHFINSKALEIREGGVWFQKGFFSKTIEWSKVKTSQLVYSTLDVGIVAKTHCDLKLFDDEGNELISYMMTWVVFDPDELCAEIKKYVPVEVIEKT